MDAPLKRRTISWAGITAIALGGSNLSIFLLGTLLNGQGTATIFLLALGLLITLFIAPGFAELVLLYPNKVGGIGAACTDAFGPYNPLLANLAGTCYWFAWVPAISFAGLFAATAMQQFYLPDVSINWLATGLIIAFTLIAFLGLKWVQRLAIPIAALGATLALLSILIPVFTGHVNWNQATEFNLKTVFSGIFGQVSSFMAGLYLVGWTAPAIENSLCYVGETKNPKKNVPLALFASAILATLYFAICPIIWLGVLGQESLMKDMLGQELWPAFAPMMGPFAKTAAAWFMIFNMLICIIAPIMGPPRTLAQLAQDGLLPAFLGRTSRFDVPWVATIITSCAAILIIWIGAPLWLMAATNFAYLITLTLASVAVWLLRNNAPQAVRLYRAPKGFITLGLLGAVGWMLATVLGFQQFGIHTVIFGIAFAFVGSILFIWRKISDRRKKGMRLIPKTLHLKLTGTMVTVLMIDAVGYLIAISNIQQTDTGLNAILIDIFVLVALITLSVGLILPGTIANAADEVSRAARRLIKGTLTDFTKAMLALGSGNLEDAHVETHIIPVAIHSHDEIGVMAASFNELQNEIKKSVTGLNGAREGLIASKNKLTQNNLEMQLLNTSLEKRVSERTKTLEDMNQQLIHEIDERKAAESNAETLHNQLIEAARFAGMADISTSVLHNVGNVLNSINVSTALIHEMVENSGSDKFIKLVDIINHNKSDLITFFNENPQGKHTIQYLTVFADALKKSDEKMINEIFLLEKNIQHVKNIIVTQQSLATSMSVTEVIDIPQLLEDSLRLNKNIYERIETKIIRDYAPIKEIITDKVKLLQIIVNLIKNSLDSLSESTNDNKTLILHLSEQDKDHINITISDNGIGINQENINAIFSFGFTTKKDGHGFGLHSSALFAKEMGGKLSVKSEGKDKGAAFTLILPYLLVNYTSFGNT